MQYVLKPDKTYIDMWSSSYTACISSAMREISISDQGDGLLRAN